MNIILIDKETLGKLSRAQTDQLQMINKVTVLDDLSVLEFLPENRYLVIGNSTYTKVTKDHGIHLGPRGEHFGDISKMEFLRLKNETVLKFTKLYVSYKQEWITEQKFDMINDNIERVKLSFKNATTKKVTSKKNGKTYYIFEYHLDYVNDKDLEFFNQEFPDYPRIKHSGIIRTSADIKLALDILSKEDMITGLDYETNGFPFDDPEFYHMGVGITTKSGIGFYFDMEWMDTQEKNLDYFKVEYKEFLDKFDERLYTYNVGFELRCTYLLLGKMYNFHDSATLNKIEGNVIKNFSLKYTAMRYLGVPSWDDDFDYLLEKLHLMYFGHQDKKTKAWIVEPTKKDFYKLSSIWIEISKKYPNDLVEFERLIIAYWNYPYKSIPSTILGKYCNLDSFHTVLLRTKSDDLGYPDTTWNVFCDNLRLSANLEMNGYYKDVATYDQYRARCMHYKTYGYVNTTIFYLASLIPDFNNIEGNKLFNQILKLGLSPVSSKSLIQRYQDHSYESGLNEQLMLTQLGEFSYFFRDLIKTKVGNLTPELNILRKRSIFSVLDFELVKHWEYFKMEKINGFTILGDVHYSKNIDDAIYFYNKISEIEYLTHISNQLKIDEIKTELVDINGDLKSMEEIHARAKSIGNLLSPNISPDLLNEVYFKYRHMISFIVTNNYKDYDKDFINEKPYGKFEDHVVTLMELFKKDETIIRDFNIKEYDKYQIHGNLIYYIFKIRKSIEALTDKLLYFEILNHYTHYLGKTEGNWFIKAAGLWSTLTDEDKDSFLKEYDNINILDYNIYSFTKFNVCYLMTRRYTKSYNSYISGMMVNNDRNCNLADGNLITTNRFGGDLIKSYHRYSACSKKSKRWSAGIHTLPPKDQIKRVISSPEGYAMTYFDINFSVTL